MTQRSLRLFQDQDQCPCNNESSAKHFDRTHSFTKKNCRENQRQNDTKFIDRGDFGYFPKLQRTKIAKPR
jgi:hypothetical protein